MSKDKKTHQIPEVHEVSRDQNHRHSLQPKGVPEGPILRHTKSQNYGKKKKKVKVPTIPESSDEVNVSLEVINEQVKLGEKENRRSKVSRRSSQASSRLGYDNVVFEIDDEVRISRANSATSSVRSSVRNPSLQSLSVVREQYCCCSKWSPCERTLFAIVGVLTFIIIILVVTVAVLASGGKEQAKSVFAVFEKM